MRPWAWCALAYRLAVATLGGHLIAVATAHRLDTAHPAIQPVARCLPRPRHGCAAARSSSSTPSISKL